MSRELSPAEKQFIERQMSAESLEGDSIENSESSADTNSIVEAVREYKTPWYKRFMTLGFVTIGVGMFAVATVLYVLARLNTIFGSGGLNFLAEKGLTPEVEKIAGNSGFTWIRQALDIYSHRTMIIGGIIVATFLVALLFFVADYIKENRKSGRTEEETMKLLLGDDYHGESTESIDDSVSTDDVDDNTSSMERIGRSGGSFDKVSESKDSVKGDSRE